MGKVAILSTFYPFRGGIAQFSASLFRAIEKKHTVKAYTFKRQYPSFLFPGETQFVQKEDHADFIPAMQLLDSIDPFTFKKTAKTINFFSPEIYIVNYWMSFFGPAMGFIAKWIQPKTTRIAIVHNIIPHEKRFYDTFANRFFLKHHDAFVVLSETVEKDLLSILPDANILRLTHPIYSHFGAKIPQDKAHRKLRLHPEKKTLLFFGIIRDYKGLDVLIEAFSKLDDSYQLLIAGECYGSFEKYAQLIQKFDLSKRVIIENRYIADQEVTTYFSASDVCILPYKSATQSGITAISNHFCVPIIATDVGGLKETIVHEQNGLIVPQSDPELIRVAIENYFEKNQKERFEQNLMQYNHENSWDLFATKIIDFANRIAEKP
jgi:glycosyltransferase involved in cell wall biosynthesis